MTLDDNTPTRREIAAACLIGLALTIAGHRTSNEAIKGLLTILGGGFVTFSAWLLLGRMILNSAKKAEGEKRS